MNTTLSNFDNIAALKRRNSRLRMREEQNRSTANASWNIVENIVDDDENDIGTNIGGAGSLSSLNRARMLQTNGLRSSLIQNGLMRSSSRVSLIQNGLVRNNSKASILQNSGLKAKGVAVIKKGNHLNHPRQFSNTKLSSLKFSNLKLSNSKTKLSHSNLGNSKSSTSKLSITKFSNLKLSGGPLPNASVMKRNTPNSKYSYKLRDMLKSDLKIGINSSATKKLSSANNAGFTRTVSPSQHRRKIQKTNSLHDVFSQDIQILLKSLHSNEFVGTIHPQYHAQYVSDESLM